MGRSLVGKLLVERRSTERRIKRLGRACRSILAITFVVLSVCAIAPMPASAIATSSNRLLAYNIDIDMDKAREEKTVDHYGESIRDIVQSANENNVNNPDSKDDAKTTYRRESKLNDLLPEDWNGDFQQKELEDMENSDRS